MRCAASRIEIGEDAVKAGEWELRVKAEVAAGFGDGMFMSEVAAVLADQEQVEQLFMNFFEAFHALVGLRMRDVETQGRGQRGFWGAGQDIDMEAVFDGVGQTGDKIHATTRAAAGEFGVDLGIHGTGEIGDGLRGQERKEGAAAHLYIPDAAEGDVGGCRIGGVFRSGSHAVAVAITLVTQVGPAAHRLLSALGRSYRVRSGGV